MCSNIYIHTHVIGLALVLWESYRSLYKPQGTSSPKREGANQHHPPIPLNDGSWSILDPMLGHLGILRIFVVRPSSLWKSKFDITNTLSIVISIRKRALPRQAPERTKNNNKNKNKNKNNNNKIQKKRANATFPTKTSRDLRDGGGGGMWACRNGDSG